MSNSQIPKVALNNGKFMPILGLGTWKSKPGEAYEAVKWAISCGYRHIDCAFVYQNEPEIGKAIKCKIEDGTVKREDLFITSKLWNTYHRKDLVLPAIRESLKNLGLKYLDLYLIHWPMAWQEDGEIFPKDNSGKFLYSDVDYVETWFAMEEVVRLGLAKAIGLSNFNKEQISRLLSVATVQPANNQIECHPYLSQKRLANFCKSKGITVTAYSPLGSPDRPWAKPTDPALMEEPHIKNLAAKYDKTPAQILIRYQIQLGNICIPKSVTKHRIESNFDVFNFELSSDDMALIETFNCNGRLLHLEWVADHPQYPFHADF